MKIGEKVPKDIKEKISFSIMPMSNDKKYI